MTRLSIAEHSVKPGATVVEIHHPELGLIGVIYPNERGVRIVSKYFEPNDGVRFAIDPIEPPALEVFIV